MELKPSHFWAFPFESIMQNSEAELVALNIMKIRTRLGDKWGLSWNEYKKERQKDGGFSYMEKEHFDKVMPKIRDAFGAIGFSEVWTKSACKALKLNFS